MLVGISEAIRLLLIEFNQWNSVEKLVSSSHSHSNIKLAHLAQRLHYRSNPFGTYPKRFFSTSSNIHNGQTLSNVTPDLPFFAESQSLKFNEWLAGLIDGDGCFNLSKKGYASLEITLDVRDKACLFQIKDQFGGSVKLKQGQKWLRYRLHHKKGLLALINAVNGLLRNPTRLLQLGRICEQYGLVLQYPTPLTYDNGWLSGFIDSDGSIYFNISSVQIFITASQKNKLLLDPLVELYGGKIYTMSKVQAFKWTVSLKEEVLKLVDYFHKYPLRSKKMVRIRLIRDIYDCFHTSAHKASSTSIKGKIWSRFQKKWDIAANSL